MTNTTVVKKIFSSAFLLDKSKMSRMINIIDNKFKAQSIQPSFSFDATLQNGKKVSFASLDGLFSLDNTIRNSISFLTVKINGTSSDPTKILKASFSYETTTKHNISAQV